MAHLSKRFSKMNESQTVALTSLTAELLQQGIDVLTLGVGEPDFDTPEHIKQAGISAIQQERTKYTATDGLLDLRQSISTWLQQNYGADYRHDEIIITNGAKQAVAQAIFAVCDPGDEVIIPKPYWASYPEQVKLAGAVPVMLDASPGDLKISAASLKQAITNKTRLVLLNSPANPSGAVYRKDELEDFVEVAAQSGIYILADEVYDQILFDNNKFTSLSSFRKIKDQLLYVNGVSKSFAMTGWRIGFLAATGEIVQAVKKYQGHTTSNASTISQYAAIEAFKGEKSFLRDRKAAFQKRRDYVVDRLRAMPGITCIKPDGAFYAFPDVSAYYNHDVGISTSMQLCSYLLKNSNVAIVPGSAFGMDNHVRISYAASMHTLQRALDRIEIGLSILQKEY